MAVTVKCPICQKPITWGEDQPFRPFCSERCKLIDLGEWATGTYAIPTDDSQEAAQEIGKSGEG
jgi:endogenous inhibitor of DNA gyrase (YacG/DUF329 family)